MYEFKARSILLEPVHSMMYIFPCVDDSLLRPLMRYKSDGEINEYFIFCQLLPTHNSREDIFNSLIDFKIKNENYGSKYVSIRADVASAVSERYSEVTTMFVLSRHVISLLLLWSFTASQESRRH